MSPHNEFDLARIRQETFAAELVIHDEIASTNTEALQLARQPTVSLPLLVLTRRQTAGRGRGANAWWSSPGALTFTLLVDLPIAAPHALGPVSLTIGLAVTQALEKLAPRADLGLKWPNDVYLEGKKVSGILVERPLAQGSRLAIGIGINANNSLRDAPDDLQRSATSLIDQLQAPIDATQLLIECLQHLEARLRDHVQERDRLLDQWRAYSILTGKDVVVESPASTVAGTCVGIDADGAILIRQGNAVHRCLAGTVSFH